MFVGYETMCHGVIVTSPYNVTGHINIYDAVFVQRNSYRVV